jgi:glycosyltransferase involved in cell wall biosynthesis
MSDLPRVTYIICHHNNNEYLAGAIASARNQKYDGQINICVIDDASSNIIGVKQIIEQALFDGNPEVDVTRADGTDFMFGGNHKAIFLRNGPNGPSYARNRGIEAMWEYTDIFAILDADDENFPSKIDILVLPFFQSDDVGVVYADYLIFNVDTGEIAYEYKEPFDCDRLNEECIVHSGSLIKKEALEAVKDEFGFYDETMRTCEDYDLWMRIAGTTQMSIIHVSEPLSLVRTHSQNSTNTVNNSIWNQNWKRIRQKKLQRVQYEHYRMYSANTKIKAGKQ